MIRSVAAFLIALVFLSATPPAEARGFGIGLFTLADWGTEQPFLDLMKVAPAWVGHLPGQWGGMSYEEMRDSGVLDEHGWPKYIPDGLTAISTGVLNSLPVGAGGVAGRYRMTFEGTGEIQLDGLAANVTYAGNVIEFDYAPAGEDSGVIFYIRQSDPLRTGDYVRNIRIVRTDRLALYQAGEIFNPDWLAHIDRFDVLRFMDWMATNNSTLAHWQDRPEPDDFSYAINGAPLEVMVALANKTGADPWFNMPHLADDDFVRQFALAVHDSLAPELKAYVEYSNEVWNWGFEQAHWADQQSKAKWGDEGSWVRFYGGRASEVADIWAEVYGDDAPDRLVRVISTQTVWLGLERDILDSPPWVAEVPGRERPATHFDAYAVTGYFGGHLGSDEWAPKVKEWIAESIAAAGRDADALGLTGDDRSYYLADHRFDAAIARAGAHLAGGDGPMKEVYDVASLLDPTLAYQAKVAADEGLELVAYEGGTHVSPGYAYQEDRELNDFFIQLNYSHAMGDLYTQLFDGWKKLGGGVFVAYADVVRPSKWGSWGTLRHLGDSNPRWDALVAAQEDSAE